jgi:hypothetical protein
MDLPSLIPLVEEASTALIVVVLGLQVRPGGLLSIGRRPAQLLRSLLAMNVIMPVVAGTLAAAFHLHPAVQIALVALAVSPVPPILPKKQLDAGGNSPYAFGLLVVSCRRDTWRKLPWSLYWHRLVSAWSPEAQRRASQSGSRGHLRWLRQSRL